MNDLVVPKYQRWQMADKTKNWKALQGAAKIKRRLHLKKDKDGVCPCPVSECDHEGFRSERGCRKHIQTIHPWFYYFDKYPSDVVCEKGKDQEDSLVNGNSSQLSSNGAVCEDIAFSEDFIRWMCSCSGGGRTEAHANQISSRALKFLRYCLSENPTDRLTSEKIDYYLGSMEFLANFLDHITKDESIGHAGHVSYINALLEMVEYRKFKGIDSNSLNNFSVAVALLKRARKCVAKKMRVRWSEELDIDTLRRKGHWATMTELQQVIPFHIERYKNLLKDCKEGSINITPSQLTFATRFIATYLFLRVKGTRPMTYQFLTVSMVTSAAANGGFVDQKTFKTAGKYTFDSLVIDDISMKILSDYIEYVRPHLNPHCDFLLVNRSGGQFLKLDQAMGILVHDAIGKYVHPTRYRQIIETESTDVLDAEERDIVSQDQKHTSNVAKIHYRKKRSRDVAERGNDCLKKLRGEQGRSMDKSLETLATSYETEGNLDTEDIHTAHTALLDKEAEQNGVDAQGICSSTRSRNPKIPKSGAKSATDCMVLFSAFEDNQLLKGIKKHGLGKWVKILSDTSLNFAEGRTRNALLRRARTTQFQDLYKRDTGRNLF